MRNKQEQVTDLSIQSNESTPLINHLEENKEELETGVDIENYTKASGQLVEIPEQVTSLSIEQSDDTAPLNKLRKEDSEEVNFDEEDLDTPVDIKNTKKVHKKLIQILEKLENNTNNSIAGLVPVNTATSIFPEFVSPQERLLSSAATALAISFANSLISVWEHYNKENPEKCCSFKTLVDFIKSPIGAPVCSYTMLLCFKTLGDFAPQLPDNGAMLSVIGAIFAASLINGVVTQLGSNSKVNPLSRITRRDVANGMIAGITAAGFIAQIDRMLKMNMDPMAYETFGPYILPIEAAIGFVYGMSRMIIPALLNSKDNVSNDKDRALSTMNSVKESWDNINKHVRFVGNIIYISGLAIESIDLLNPGDAAAVITAVVAGPVSATLLDTLITNCCKQPKISSLITGPGMNSPIYGSKLKESSGLLSINNSEESEDQLVANGANLV